MRTIQEIGRDIRAAWSNINPYAAQYLDYMMNPWGHETGHEAALRFLGNATGWRGEDAKRLKAELRAAL